MIYDVFISVLTVLGIVGAVVFSFKIARSPIRRVGVIRELPQCHERLEDRINQEASFALQNELRDYLKEESKTQVAAKAGVLSYGLSQVALADAIAGDYITIECKPSGLVQSPDALRKYLNFESKKGYISIDSSVIMAPLESNATIELQDKVDDLNERLKKVESALLRGIQESRDEESDEKAEYIQ